MNSSNSTEMSSDSSACRSFVPLDTLSQLELPWKDKVAYMAYILKKMDTGVQAPLTHRFEDGMYIREMALPADAIVIGRPHRHGHRCVLMQGTVLLVTEKGRVRFDSPAEIHTQPGDQIVAYAVTDIVARTYHPNPTESRDIEALENQWFDPAEPVLSQGQRVYQTLAEGKLP